MLLKPFSRPGYDKRVSKPDTPIKATGRNEFDFAPRHPPPWGPTVMSNHRLALSATSAYLRNPVSCDRRRHSTWNVPASAQGHPAQLDFTVVYFYFVICFFFFIRRSTYMTRLPPRCTHAGRCIHRGRSDVGGRTCGDGIGETRT